jgi:hypothetical protein
VKKIKITLCDIFDSSRKFSYTITPYDNSLSIDWLDAIENDIIQNQRQVRQNFNFLGFPNTYRNFEYLCNILNSSIEKINSYKDIWASKGLDPYVIEERYSKEQVVFKNGSMNHKTLNFLHNHFEELRGTVWEPSVYTKASTPEMILQIENLNFCCHELESLIFTQYHWNKDPDVIRPSNIMTFHNMKLFDIKTKHKNLILENAFDRRFGEVYMHWSQIGKRLDEVFRDEHAPDLIIGDDPYDIKTAGTQCEAINSLRYYCGGFDIDWGRNMTRENDLYWNKWHKEFFVWVEKNGLDPKDPNLMLGFLPIGKVDIEESFGTTDKFLVWKTLTDHMKIYSLGYKNKEVIFS